MNRVIAIMGANNGIGLAITNTLIEMGRFLSSMANRARVQNSWPSFGAFTAYPGGQLILDQRRICTNVNSSKLVDRWKGECICLSIVRISA